MPSPHLTDIAKLRLENISFFLAGFLLSALFIKLLWNYLASDWTFLPRLSYFRALGVVTLWGLLFVLVLTMISGARELMTPGAWEKKGATYQLADDIKASRMQERKDHLAKLKAALWTYSDTNAGKLPQSPSDAGIADALWTIPDPSGVRYIYVGGARADAKTPLAFEPELFGNDRLVLCVDGVIRMMTSEDISKALPEVKR
ncbi:MAG: hypothetical protein EXS16_16560 [Gemmataceae bacterium]|nr:hypothetical protein [Gemmataceae bacterium]